jgi:hypothetical protein
VAAASSLGRALITQQSAQRAMPACPQELITTSPLFFRLKQVACSWMCANALRQTPAVSGVQKVHAVLGGFHLGRAADYLANVVAEIKKLNRDVLIQCTAAPQLCGRGAKADAWARSS